jgi:hypothetical protein
MARLTSQYLDMHTGVSMTITGMEGTLTRCPTHTIYPRFAAGCGRYSREAGCVRCWRPWTDRRSSPVPCARRRLTRNRPSTV